jgi:quinol-cytochrome oxidoreductase complex cytochrome b subunit
MSDSLLHSDNFMQADRLSTPPHITPEWYFLPFYSLLRAVDNKLLGVSLLVFCIMQIGIIAMGGLSLLSSYCLHVGSQ